MGRDMAADDPQRRLDLCGIDSPRFSGHGGYGVDEKPPQHRLMGLPEGFGTESPDHLPVEGQGFPSEFGGQCVHEVPFLRCDGRQ